MNGYRVIVLEGGSNGKGLINWNFLGGVKMAVNFNNISVYEVADNPNAGCVYEGEMVVEGSDNSVLDADVQSRLNSLYAKLNDPDSYAGSFAEALVKLKEKSGALKNKTISSITNAEWKELGILAKASELGFEGWKNDVEANFGTNPPSDVQNLLDSLEIVQQELATLGSCISQNISSGNGGGGGNRILSLRIINFLTCTVDFEALEVKQSQAVSLASKLEKLTVLQFLINHPELDEDWLKFIEDVVDFYEECEENNQPYVSGIIPYCYWKNEEVIAKYIADRSFTSGIIDDLYGQYEGLKNIGSVTKKLEKGISTLIYAFTAAFIDCNSEMLHAKEEDFEYYAVELSKVSSRSDFWSRNVVHIREHQLGNTADDIIKCEESKQIRDVIGELVVFIQNFEKLEKALDKVATVCKKYFDKFTDTDRNETRYLHGQLVGEVITLIVPNVIAAKGAKVEAAIAEIDTKLPQLEIEIQKILGKIPSFFERLERLSLTELKNSLQNYDNHLKFIDEFWEASDDALREINKNDLFSYWKENSDIIKNNSYPNVGHKAWDDTRNGIITKADPTETKILNAIENAPPPGNKVAVAGAYSPELPNSNVIIKYNDKNFNVSTLEPELQQHLNYLQMIKNDFDNGGKLYQKLYTNVPEFKIQNAEIAGTHAEVLATNEVIKLLKNAPGGSKFNGIQDLNKIHVLVKGRSSLGNMCRCPHCFQILDGVKMIGNQ